MNIMYKGFGVGGNSETYCTTGISLGSAMGMLSGFSASSVCSGSYRTALREAEVELGEEGLTVRCRDEKNDGTPIAKGGRGFYINIAIFALARPPPLD